MTAQPLDGWVVLDAGASEAVTSQRLALVMTAVPVGPILMTLRDKLPKIPVQDHPAVS